MRDEGQLFGKAEREEAPDDLQKTRRTRVTGHDLEETSRCPSMGSKAMRRRSGHHMTHLNAEEPRGHEPSSFFCSITRTCSQRKNIKVRTHRPHSQCGLNTSASCVCVSSSEQNTSVKQASIRQKKSLKTL